MGSLRILKADLHPFCASSRTNGLSYTGTVKLDNRMFRVCCKNQNANESSTGEEPPESLFMKELKRRGITPTSLPDKSEEMMMYKEEDANISLNQREQSMALNSEGLEGLIPRGSLLLRLGGTFFLAFWPFILITLASFSAIYLYLGPKFVHDGTTKQIQLPQYIDPYELLQDGRISQTSPILN